MSAPEPPEFHLIERAIRAIVRDELDRLQTRILVPVEPKPYLTTDEAAELMRCKRKRIYDLAALGKLDVVRDGARVLVPRAAIDDYLGTLQRD